MDEELACTERKLVRRVVSRLSKGDLVGVFLDWGLVAEEPASWPSRPALIDLLTTGHLEHRMTYRQYASLSLRRLYSKARTGAAPKWGAYHLAARAGALAPSAEVDALKAVLTKELSVFFNNYVHVEQAADGDVWIFIGIYEGVDAPRVLPPRSQTMFIMWRPHTSHLFASEVKVAYREYIMQALMHAFAADAIEQVPVRGANLESIIKLTLDAAGLGVCRAHTAGVPNPLALPRTRMHAAPVALGAPLPDAVVEDAPALAARARKADATLGPDDAPDVEQLIFHVNSSWDVSALPLNANDVPVLPFVARVSLDGPSVVNGLKALIPAGILHEPLPPFYTTILNQQRTVFRLADSDLSLTVARHLAR
ncbi:uncharacterized protein AMSG_04481 [Thecamonas trahens ATCC 50062]|uniref:Uncharacterized protein n=1 Tax=Thecamonas trahens ATCC 50062 TaxID=461836 RepID=A0A0L0D7B9_THETB|nr:hypothetical protein AMSG_04481 [Thecamonas trahens ATCC 50062]KNC48249.1 hypothetical protein AMSG_04481 [Thecamonas trahens ATCC 50062]|eukprot:XP_013758818.1 hypothetical protein AMSG_04481 [Thecamonas trahens ATCC 50062]